MNDPVVLYHKYIIEMKSTRQVAKELGTHQVTVRKWLQEANIPIRPTGFNNRSKGFKLTEEHKAKIAAAHIGKSRGFNPGDNPRWTREEVLCTECGKLKWVKQCHKKFPTHFCNQVCHGVWKSKQIGNLNPKYKNYLEIPCTQCNKVVRRKPSNIKPSGKVFCNRTCHNIWRSIHQTGATRYNWTGGYEPYYGPTWGQARRDTRRRDNYTCQNCGITQTNLGRAMDVHHINPFRNFGPDRHEEANRLENLISYCNKCHKIMEEQQKREVVAA